MLITIFNTPLPPYSGGHPDVSVTEQLWYLNTYYLDNGPETRFLRSNSLPPLVVAVFSSAVLERPSLHLADAPSWADEHPVLELATREPTGFNLSVNADCSPTCIQKETLSQMSVRDLFLCLCHSHNAKRNKESIISAMIYAERPSCALCLRLAPHPLDAHSEVMLDAWCDTRNELCIKSAANLTKPVLAAFC